MILQLRRIFLLMGICILAFSAVGPRTAVATSFYERSFPDTVQDAPVIVRGRIGTSYTDWGRGEDSNKRIYTYWELQIGEVFKGGAGGGANTLLMREMGGEKDGVGMQVSGAANFNPGEDVVVFLSERNAEGSYDVWGMMMGKFNLQKDENGEEILIGPGINHLTQSRIGDAHGSQADTPGGQKWTLAKLRELIRSQSGGPDPAQNPSKNPGVVPPAKVTSQTSPYAAPADSLAAPQLQNSSPEERSSWPGMPWVIGGGALGLAMVYMARRRG